MIFIFLNVMIVPVKNNRRSLRQNGNRTSSGRDRLPVFGWFFVPKFRLGSDIKEIDWPEYMGETCIRNCHRKI